MPFNPNEFIVHCKEWDQTAPTEPSNLRSVTVPGERDATVQSLRKEVCVRCRIRTSSRVYNETVIMFKLRIPNLMETLVNYMSSV